MFLQIPIAPPTNRCQVLRFPIPIITIQIIHRQTIAPHVGIFRPPAIFTPILSTYFCKFGHPLKQIQPSLIPRLEEMVYLLFGRQPLHTNFPSSKLTRLGIAFYVPMRPSAIPGGFAHCNQFGYFRFFSHCNFANPHRPERAGVRSSRIPAPPVPRRCPIRKDVLIFYHKFLFTESCNNPLSLPENLPQQWQKQSRPRIRAALYFNWRCQC